MLSSLLRPKKARQRVEEHSPFSSPYPEPDYSPIVARRERQIRHATADWTETEADDDEEENTEEGEEEDNGLHEDQDDEGEDGDGDESTPLLPIFSAAHLDSLPVYNLTHAIRLVVLPKTETTLTWDQLRSPQVSQFLVKPMQQQVRSSHFSRATLYALMANCLQFQKEGQANPGNAGVSRTRAMVCELLAVKLLKEYSTRELIDALSYDFFPLQGLVTPSIATPAGQTAPMAPARPAAARTSTVEVAIRASAKRFLAHPLVVQQLEAIWAGTIVFHSAADNLHRKRPTTSPIQMKERRQANGDRRHLLVPGEQHVTYGATISPGRVSPDKQPVPQPGRRTVTLYDPRDASLFKLSRLRVPRYRQFFSTCSLAILLGLFVAVLAQRSTEITALEVIFWFWSAGFMLDEVVGFNEQGFSLYILSFWNTFDLGILMFLTIYYSMRLYGLFLVDIGRNEWDSMAYDVLATNAILLFPRLFSVLDHSRYFSQLLIAFRLMAVDLCAVFVLILIACSGFFVAFTLSFKHSGTDDYDAAGVAYKIFQILMGFTPAAWDAWSTYNPLGKAILVLFLFICHFLVVTILITVLTNSFMAIVSNANEEHQFVFAVNTISMVKNDALFSYVAPSNIVAWLLTPLRFCVPFRAFIKLNRTIIKITHFPLLFSIYAYEKLFLARSVFEPTDLVERRGRKRLVSFNDTKSLFSPSVRMRQESVAGFQKDRALDEVFRLAPRPNALRNTQKSTERRKTHSVVNNWMDLQGDHPSPPQEERRSIVDGLELREARRTTMLRNRRISGTRSVASDPAEFMSTAPFHNAEDDGDGDDELPTVASEDDHITLDKSHSHPNGSDDDYFTTPTGGVTRLPSLSSKPRNPIPSSLKMTSALKSSPPRMRAHNRNMSTNTILYNPLSHQTSSSNSPPKSRPLTAKRSSRANTGANTPATGGPGHRTPKASIYTTANTKPRPIMPSRQHFQSVPNFNLDSAIAGNKRHQLRHRQSSLDMGMSDLGFDGHNQGMLGAVPSSFATQMAMATGGLKGLQSGTRRREETDGMMGRLMLARMKTLEESFAEVIREVRGMRTAGNSSVEGANDYVETKREKGKGREKEKLARKKKTDRKGPLARTISEVDIAKQGAEIRGVENLIPMGEDGAGDHDAPEGLILERYATKGSSL
ncbi:integral membrane channel protein [Amylocarpus encephaloides]|uniref:Integral membrane channel protein n=1 Tax=Amylocarpus encephaloides TaxID=45428 RepID=A0A9P7YGA6_9HELO|nr:integral membrane channel protein [Amylocarpus encephaloides]